jgi:hypothetical protein
MKKVLLSILLVGVLIVSLVALTGCDLDETSSSSSTSSATVYNIGDTIQNKKYEITINSVEQREGVGSEYLNSSPAEGGIYVCINYTYKNISTEPLSTWSTPTIKLQDANGTKYSTDISASSYYATEIDPDRKILSDLNPGITVTDGGVFEISKESYNQGEWFIIIDSKIKVKIK